MNDDLWIFPGQGGQRAGMLEQVPADLKKYVSDLLDMELLDSDAGYQDSVQIQVSITLLQVFEIQQLFDLGLKPGLAAGHSLGVFPAAYALGCMSLEDVFKSVKYRAELMKESFPAGYGMGAINGLSLQDVDEIVQQVTTSDAPVFTSNQNSALQICVSGSLNAIDQVLKLAQDLGAAKAIRLRVPVPSHSPLMNDVAKKMKDYLNVVQIKAPQGVYLANDTGHSVRQSELIRQDLSDNIAYPVHFWEMMSVASNYQPKVLVDFQPGSPFKAVLGEYFSEQHQVNLNQMTIEDAAYLIKKWKRGS
ncbi:acyltransferase domain-containing protein [Xylocopilactobacillus apicola]|uniref:acyltransferase domain-containing protein n=1 Tax=Xylocopilactobacillus apicola TaxID=2932184 RepID=UPI0029529C25|nr:acyltransferase domain-containing protein [Xylocopilactobacillus apicola]